VDDIRLAGAIRLAVLNDQPEIFYSIQGEGLSIGRPTIFVRTSLCNLHCVWCDTDYTWNWEGTPFAHVNDAEPGYTKFVKKDWSRKVPLQEVVAAISAIPCRRIVWTGGEPMMQQKALAALMQMLHDKDPQYHFEVETNGTYLPAADFDQYVHQYNVSPKLANSGNTVQLRERPKAMHFFAKSHAAFFKYVVANEVDLEEVLGLVKKYKIAHQRVWLMPQADSRKNIEAMRQEVVDLCLLHGFNYSDRLHVQIWDKKKGV
jgi:7-carboxy-7-deazaguanine synthase